MRNILIDTHILIWWLASPDKIKNEHLDLIANPENTIYVSVASFFEISLKVKKGKLNFDFDYEEILLQNDFESLTISLNHLKFLRKNEFPNQDPFDMVIISQAICENLEFISYDEAFKGFSNVKVL